MSNTFNDQHDITFTDRTFNNTTVKFNWSRRITIKNCLFDNSSLYFINCRDIKVENCSFLKTNTKHAIQSNKTKDISIINNYFEEPIGTSKAEDIINIYKSNNAVIRRNYLRGGGPSKSGGGIILGDNMGDNSEASDNVCIDCGQYGMAIAGGNNNRLINNAIMGKRFDWSNVGLYVWGIPQRNSRVTNAQVIGNYISWKKKDGTNNSMWISNQNVQGTIQRDNRVNIPYDPPRRPADNGYISRAGSSTEPGLRPSSS